MLNADVQQAHILPRAVHDVLPEATATGLSGAYAWALHRQQLLLWKTEDGLQAVVRRLHLDQPPAGRIFVQIVPHSSSAAVTVVLCTGSGQLCVWMDAHFPAPPFCQRLAASANSSTAPDALICALAASPADAGTSLGFVAVVATADAALHLYHGSQSGIFPRQFHKPAVQPRRQAGLLGALGSAVKAMYCEAFDPLQRVQRTTASAMAALQLQLLQLDGSRWKLLVLTPEALDCWLLGAVSGQHRGEQLLWSYNLPGDLADRQQAREVEVLGFAASTSQQQHQHEQLPASAAVPAAAAPTRAAAGPARGVLYVWSAQLAGTSTRHEHAVSCLTLEEGDVVPTYQQSASLSRSADMPAPDPSGLPWQLAPHSCYSSCLLLSPNGVVMEWALPSSVAAAAGRLPAARAAAATAAPAAKAAPPRVLSSSAENLAVACATSGAAPNWQLLNESYGVLEFRAGESGDCATPGAAAVAGIEMGPQQQAAALELLDRTVELMFKECSAGCSYRELADGLAGRLGQLGVFNEDGRGRALLVAVSRSLVDRMPKAGGSGGWSSGGWASGSLQSVLAAKTLRHDMLLTAYQTGGVLPLLQPDEARPLFDHAEMLAAVVQVLQWRPNAQAVAAAGGATAVVGQESAAMAVIQEAAEKAAARDDASPASTGQQGEAFYSRPTVSVPALFEAVAKHADAVRDASAGNDSGDAATQGLQQVLDLAALMGAVLAGAGAKARQLQHGLPDEVARQSSAGPSWTAGQEPADALKALSEACLQLYSRLPEPSERLLLARQGHLPALDALLTCFQEQLRPGIISATHAAVLHQEYQELAVRHGHCLLQIAAEELEARSVAGDLAGIITDTFGTDRKQEVLVWLVEALAQRHNCHELLFNTCNLLTASNLTGGTNRLLEHMEREARVLGGAVGQSSFTFYVMERLRSSGQLPELLQLGRQGFHQQLQVFLQPHPSLLWMCQVQSGALEKAAHTLQVAASAEQASYDNCRRLVCLTRLAAYASTAGAGAAMVQAAEVLQTKAGIRARQLDLQQQLDLTQRPLTAAQLAQAALQQAAEGVGGTAGAAAAAVGAVEALCLAPEQQASEDYRQLWDQSWQAVLQQTPLQQLAAARASAQADGESAAATAAGYGAVLRCSPLYVALTTAAASLALASKVQAGVDCASILDAVGEQVMARVASGTPAAASCVGDVLQQAAQRASENLLVT